MFKGIQKVLQGSGSKIQVPEDFIAVERASKLLAKEKYQTAISQLRSVLSSFDDLQFDNHCLNLIERFAEFIQLLPETQNGYFFKPGGMLEHGLFRAVKGAQQTKSYLATELSAEEVFVSRQLLWTYAAFSAGLLLNIGKLVVDFQVALFDQRTGITTHWLAWEGSMLEKATHYSYQFVQVKQDDFRRRISLILARQLMPLQSFLWLASDDDIFSAWLGMLEDDDRDGGLIGKILPTVDADLIQQDLLNQVEIEEILAKKRQEKKDALNEKEEFIKEQDKKLSSLFDNKNTENDAVRSEQQLGKDFYAWLVYAIAHDEVKVNQTNEGVFVTQDGILLTESVFEQFSKEFPNRGDSSSVIKSFLGLEVHQTYNNQIWNGYFNTQTQQNVVGVMIRNANLLMKQNTQATANLVVKNPNVVIPPHLISIPQAPVQNVNLNVRK